MRKKPRKKLIRVGFVNIFQKNLAYGNTSRECKFRMKGFRKAKLKLHQPYEFKAVLNEHTHPAFQSKYK